MNTNSDADRKYILIDTNTCKTLQRGCVMKKSDADAKNYAFGLNAVNKKYVEVS